ncbi:MAG: hypothetical protein GX787_01915 [Tissierellia bacterium]|nr:hypothetical protein [Tissierellia bacterium]
MKIRLMCILLIVLLSTSSCSTSSKKEIEKVDLSIGDKSNAMEETPIEEIPIEEAPMELTEKDDKENQLLLNLIEEDDEKKLINRIDGYFVKEDRLDIALLYGIGAMGYYDYFEIVLANGLTGEKISILREETINMYMDIDTFDTTGNDDHIIALSGFEGGTATAHTVDFYIFNGEYLEKLEYNINTDLEITIVDNFKYRIKSQNLGIDYTFPLNSERKPYYISDGIYNKDGKLLVSRDPTNGCYDMSIIVDLDGKDYVLCSFELMDSLFTDSWEDVSHLINIESYFRLQGDELVLVDLLLKDTEGELIPNG